jgi:hypothetical protein
VPLVVVDVGAAGPLPGNTYRLVLVRPDQHVAWRGDTVPGDARALIDLIRGARRRGHAIAVRPGRLPGAR